MKNQASGYGGALRAVLMLSAGALAAALPAAAFAQEESSGSEASSGDEAAVGNEILVTATKREQTLQQTPVAVSVATGEAIQRAEIRDLKDLQTIVPSLRVSQLQSSANTNFIIRGFGNGANNAGIEPSVGVFVDGVYRSRTASQVNDLPNVSRIEVLRGPQSTLFGKNASAGVISIITEEPQFDLGGSVEASYGNYNAVVLKGYVTGPVSDAVAVSMAGGYSSRDGYNRDLATGDRTNERNRYFLRGQLLFEPSSDFKARIIADYDRLDENCCGAINLQSSGATAVIGLLGGQVTDPNNRYAGVVYNNFNSTNDIRNWGVSGQLDWNLGTVQLTSITAYRNNSARTAQDADFSSADLIHPIGADVNLDTFTQEFRLTTDIADVAHILLGGFFIHEKVAQTGELKWGSDARNYASTLVQSLSGGALSLPLLEGAFGTYEGNPAKYAGKFFQAGTGNDETFGLKSQAISIFGQADFDVTDRLTLTMGGNYTSDTKDYSASIVGSDVFSQIDFNNPAYAGFRNTLLYQGGLAAQVGNALMLGRPATAQEIGQFAANDFATYSYISGLVQGYANANQNNPAANPLNPLKALQYLPQFVAVPNAVEDGHIHDGNFSYTIRLAYDVSDDVNVYASYGTGFKAASVNLSRDSRPLLADMAALASAGLLKVNQSFGTRYADPEISKVYELGLKANVGKASANIAIFKQEIAGFQSNTFTGSGFSLSNAGKQSTFGVEFEGQAELVPEFTVNLGVTYLDPKYDDFVYSAVGDLSGTKPAGIPEWTAIIGGQYNHRLGNGDRLILASSFHYESEVQIADGLPGFLDLGAAAAVAAAAPFRREVKDLTSSITYAFDSGLELSIWGRNLLDDRYIIQIFDSVAQPHAISGYANQPRTFGATARFKW